MREYAIRQVLSLIPVVFLVSVISFALLYVLPGDPATALIGERVTDQATYNALRHSLGLDQPIWVQYLKWLGRALHGDLGRSIRTGEPVTQILLSRAPISLYLGFCGLVVGLVIGVPIAIVSALRPGSWLDSVTTVFALAGIAMPSFWQALIFIYVFSLFLHWLPPTGYTSIVSDPILNLKMIAMPAVVLGTHTAAVLMRQTRSSLLEVLDQEYVVTSRAKGLAQRHVILIHAMKNAMIPVITILGLEIGQIAAGAAITETVFAIPGVGRTAVDAIGFRDMPVLQGAILMLTISVVLGNLIADLLFGYLDPRIRYR